MPLFIDGLAPARLVVWVEAELDLRDELASQGRVCRVNATHAGIAEQPFEHASLESAEASRKVHSGIGTFKGGVRILSVV